MSYTYIDLDLSFQRHPGTKDVLKKTDVNSVKFALRNLFLTNPGEVPFNPDFGIGIRQYLFENMSPIFINILKRRCLEQISWYEPRIIVDGINISDEPDSNALEIEVSFHTIADSNPVVLNFNFERTR